MNMEELKVTIALMVGLLVVLVGNLIMTYISFQQSIETTIKNVNKTYFHNGLNHLDIARYKKFLEKSIESERY